MKRRRFLAAATATTLLTGCNALSSSDEFLLGKPAPPSRDELESEQRPPAERPPDATAETVPPREYSSTPSAYDSEAVVRFVESHERAYRCNALLDRFGGDLVSIQPYWDWTVSLATSESAGVGRCHYRYSTKVAQDDGSVVIGDSPSTVVTYYVDDSMIVRAEATGAASSRKTLDPDPWESGTILESGE